MTIFTAPQQRTLREAYETDAATRAEIKRSWKEVLQYIRNAAPEYSDLHQIKTRAGFGWAIPHGLLDIPDDLQVVFAPDSASWLIYRGPSVVPSYMIILGGVLKSSWDKSDLSFRLPPAERSFVHEYTHYLDRKRRLAKGGPGGDKDRGTDFTTQYAQSPAEYNAWYQSQAAQVEHSVESLLVLVDHYGAESERGKAIIQTLQKHFKSYESFWAWYFSHLRSDDKLFLAALLHSKWERKWYVRMHALYQGLKTRVMNVLEAPRHISTERVRTPIMSLFTEARRQALREAANGGVTADQKTLAALHKMKGGEKIVVLRQPFVVVKAIEGPKRRELVLQGAKKQAHLFLPSDATRTATLQKGARNVYVTLSQILIEEALREASGSVNKYDIRRAQEAWEDAFDQAKSYEEDGDPRAKEFYQKADELKKALEDLKVKWEKQKAKSREYSRARSSAMASIGMKRTRSGGWE